MNIKVLRKQVTGVGCAQKAVHLRGEQQFSDKKFPFRQISDKN